MASSVPSHKPDAVLFAPARGFRENIQIVIWVSRLMGIFRLILDIALLQRGPQALPAASWVTAAALAAYGVVGMVAHRMIAPGMNPIGPVFFDLFLMAGFVMSLLYWRGFPGRAYQTLAALAGTGTLLTLCGLPVIRLLEPGAQGDALASVGAILWLALMGWSLLVTAHILRHSLAVSLPAGVLVGMIYMMISIFFYGMLFGTAQ